MIDTHSFFQQKLNLVCDFLKNEADERLRKSLVAEKGLKYFFHIGHFAQKLLAETACDANVCVL